MRLHCPNCDKPLKIPDDTAGKRVRCPGCAEAFAVPEPPEEEETEAEEAPPRKRKKRKKRRKPDGNALKDTLHYWTGAVGLFPIFSGLLVMMWLFVGAVALFIPPLAWLLVMTGSLTYVVGWGWFLFVAFRDNPMWGALCFITQFFCIPYFFMNMEETWKPATLLVLGILMSLTGWGILEICLAGLRR